MIWTALEKVAAADQGPTVRETHPGTFEKLSWWHRYCSITTTAMVGKTRPASLTYLDLFAGPGVLQLKSGERKPGSPMIAAHTKKKFDRMIFCEKDEKLANALRQRLDSWKAGERSTVLVGDCNDLIGDVKAALPPDGLTLAFIDPTGLQFRWDSLTRLTKGTKVDLLILIPDSMDIHRNKEAMLRGDDLRLDAALGPGCDWREKFQNLPTWNRASVCRAVEDLYREQLSSRLGYTHMGSQAISKYAGSKQKLYTILFASRHHLGMRFWKASVEKERQAPRLALEFDD